MTDVPPPADQEGSQAGALEDFAVRARMAARTSRLDEALVKLLDACDTVGVEPLLLKGAALARTLYRSDESRGYYDVDLLVAEADLPVIGEVLEGLGYRNVSELQGVDDVAGILHAQIWSRLAPEYGNLTIDLHWQLYGCEAPPQIVWDALSTRRELIDVAGREVRTLDRPGLALHLALHVAQHGPDDLKAAGDLSRGLERWSPEIWRQAAELAGELRALEALAAGLRLVPGGEAVATRLELPDADVLLWQIEHRGERPRGTFHMQAFTDARGLGERIQLLRRSLLPSRAWIVWEHPWAANGPLRFFAAYCAHVVRAPAWAIRAWRFRRRKLKLLTAGSEEARAPDSPAPRGR
jgi:Uncharacterised nucleotidyltransferase